MFDNKKVILVREQLYNEIWEISASGVAKKYEMHYASLLKLCKDADIPIPPSGYWMKISYGKEVEKPPLPQSDITEIVLPFAPPPRKGKAKPDSKINKNAGDSAVGTTEPQHQVSEKELPDLKQTDEEIAGQDDLDELMPWRKTGRHNFYKRDKLYEQVWSKPVLQVAAQYGVSNTTIKKICRELNVPVPPRGYWAKLKAGKKTKRMPLPDTKGQTQFVGERTHSGLTPSAQDTQHLSFLPDQERAEVLAATREMELPTEDIRLHKKIKTHKALVTIWNKNNRKAETAKRSISSYSDRPPFLAGVISKETLPRVYRLLTVLYNQVEVLGGVVNDDLSVQIRGEHVSLNIYEGQDEVKHEITKDEAQAMLIYEDAMRHRGWGTKPQIRKYDYYFNGHLRVSIRKNKFFKETSKGNLESRLGDILIDLYEESETVRLARIKREEEARKREEEEKQREVFKENYNKEVDKTLALENAAMDYERALRIRTYIAAVKEAIGTKEVDQETTAWLAWANVKADWYDPIVAGNDKYFGKRGHGNDEDSKELKKLGYYW